MMREESDRRYGACEFGRWKAGDAHERGVSTSTLADACDAPLKSTLMKKRTLAEVLQQERQQRQEPDAVDGDDLAVAGSTTLRRARALLCLERAADPGAKAFISRPGSCPQGQPHLDLGTSQKEGIHKRTPGAWAALASQPFGDLVHLDAMGLEMGGLIRHYADPEERKVVAPFL